MSQPVPSVTTIIDNSIHGFLAQIRKICDIDPFRAIRKIPPAFPLLQLANDEFYEYAYFERTLEWYVRDLLFKPIFDGLFRLREIEPLWPENKTYIRFNTEKIEDIFPFEFIIKVHGETIGVRYTSLCAGEADSLRAEYQLDRIVQIQWDKELTSRDVEESEYTVLDVKKFFITYLSLTEYETFISKLIPAIQEANKEIGFETIPRLSLRYLSGFKMDVAKERREDNYVAQRYMMLPRSRSLDNLDNLSFSANDYRELNNNFVEKGLYNALTGTEGFAKCFVTAEYQYRIFRDGNSFDYTSVISGYLKFIEQLVYKLVKIRLSDKGSVKISDMDDSDKLWIKCKRLKPRQRNAVSMFLRQHPDPKAGSTQILFHPDNERCFDITLNPLIWFIHDDVNGWNISDSGRQTVHQLLRNFADECRNDHFHKDNIDDYTVVKRIRNNTILLAYLLLGGYKLSGDYEKDCEELGIISGNRTKAFESLYKKIRKMPSGVKKFIIIFPGKKPIKAYRHYFQEPTVYDINGSVSNSVIKFVEVDCFDWDEYDKAMQGKYPNREFLITAKNIPEKISYINGHQEEVLIEWDNV